MLPLAERIQRLHAQGVRDADIAVRLGCELQDVENVLDPPERAAMVKRGRGRPSSAGRCMHCGAPPCEQSPIKTSPRSTTQP